MRKLVLVRPYCREKHKTGRLTAILENSLKGYEYETINTPEELEDTDLRNKNIIFAVSLGETGINLELYGMLKKIRQNKDCFQGSVGGIIVDGNSELYTKSIGREITLSANLSGCAFVGKPLVEGTGSLDNFNIIAKNLETDNLGAYIDSGRKLVESVVGYKSIRKERPKISVIHASNSKTSNTLAIWEMVKNHLADCQIKEISVRNGEVMDCIGCPYSTCLHFGEEDKCFYGGVVVEQVYPAILECDALVMLCANYNDALSANLAAVINRITALFRKHSFKEKSVFAVIVSGYSGSDILAEQLISGINMNKNFILPGRFALMETANNPGSSINIHGIEARTKSFAENMKKHLGVCYE